MELLLFLFFLPDTKLDLSIKLSQSNQHEQSENILKSIRARETKNPEKYMFYRFLNNFRMNNKKEAEKYAEYLQGIELELPERYQVLTSLMKEDMKHWKNDDLEDIARDMSHAKDRLSNYDGGKTTKKIQDDIIAKLDKMIKEKEDKANNQSQNSNDQAQQRNPSQPQQPAQDSNIQNDGGTGQVNKVKFKNLTERWNSLPPRERTAALQELTQGMSSRHREAIENYFRRLAEAQIKK